MGISSVSSMGRSGTGHSRHRNTKKESIKGCSIVGCRGEAYYLVIKSEHLTQHVCSRCRDELVSAMDWQMIGVSE